MADTKFSAIAAATSIAATDEIIILQAATGKRITAALLRDFLFTAGLNSPGSFTIADDQYVQMVRTLTLTGSQRGTILGDGRLRID
jgi:hypothetical protein